MTETYRTYSSTFLSEKVSEDECHPLPLWEVPWNPPGLLFLVGKKIQAFLFFFFFREIICWATGFPSIFETAQP